MTTEAFRERSRQTWNSMAAGWEARDAFLEDNMGLLSDWMIERVAPTSGDVVLEVGSGPGDLGRRFAGLVGPQGRVVATDFAEEMVEVARRLGAVRSLGNIDHRQLDAEAMDLDDDCVDAVVSRAVLMLVSDPPAALAEARRVLRPGGSLAFTVFTTPDRNPWAATAASVLVGAGHLDPPEPGAPGVFSLGDPDRLRALLHGAGFVETVIEHVDFVFDYRDADDAWNAIVDLNGPLAGVVARLSEAERDATRRAVLDGYAPFRRPDGSYPVPAQALAVHAR